jgi:hypothetical protein
MVDGMDNNDREIGTVIVRPSVDALAEVSVQTNLYTAEVGRAAGGVVNLITKSGTNAVHGTLYEYFRNDDLDAAPFRFVASQPKAEYRLNQYGGSAGGPIKKDKTFFFFDGGGKDRRFFGVVTEDSDLRPCDSCYHWRCFHKKSVPAKYHSH